MVPAGNGQLIQQLAALGGPRRAAGHAADHRLPAGQGQDVILMPADALRGLVVERHRESGYTAGSPPKRRAKECPPAARCPHCPDLSPQFPSRRGRWHAPHRAEPLPKPAPPAQGRRGGRRRGPSQQGGNLDAHGKSLLVFDHAVLIGKAP